MAVVAQVTVASKTLDNTFYTTWNAVSTATADTFQMVENPSWADRSIQLTGAVGATGFNGGTVTIQGSNDGTNWSTLTDPQGVALTFAASGIKQISEMTRFLRPSLSVAATGSAGVAIVLAARRN